MFIKNGNKKSKLSQNIAASTVIYTSTDADLKISLKSRLQKKNQNRLMTE